MTVWQLILLASIVVLALKVSGYLVPEALLEKPTPSRVANLLTVALLAALVVTQTLASGSSIVLDARVPALIVAAGLLVVRAPFIVVVAAAALTAALIRAFT
ncbi:MAG: AzlD domain-containing protein [Microbacteriaceae bacterium]